MSEIDPLVLYPIPQAAVLVGIEQKHFYKIVMQEHLIPFVMIGGQRKILGKDLLAYQEKHQKSNAPLLDFDIECARCFLCIPIFRGVSVTSTTRINLDSWGNQSCLHCEAGLPPAWQVLVTPHEEAKKYLDLSRLLETVFHEMSDNLDTLEENSDGEG